MPQMDKDKLRAFEQRLRDEGADGFADGPRPWEHWDESGNQANNRVWEGHARNLDSKKHSVGYRLLSFLAFLALTTLLVGVGGVYYTHTQQQLADSGAQSQPVIEAQGMVKRDPVAVTATEPDDLNILTAPAAGSTQPPAIVIPPPPSAEIAAEETAPGTTTLTTVDNNIDSVAIETIVTGQSVTTTVYTRHPQQDEPVVIAAIETTPPPFAHEIVPAPEYVQPDTDESATASEPFTEPAVAASETVLTEEQAIETAPEPVSDVIAEPVADAEPDQAVIVETEPEFIPDIVVAAAPEYEPAPEVVVEAAPEPVAEIVLVAATESEAAPDPIAEIVVVAEPEPEAVPVVVAETLPEPIPEIVVAATPEPEVVPEITVETSPEPLVEPVEEVIPDPAPVAEPPPVTKAGNWVVNLSSYSWKSTANRKRALFASQGVEAEVFETTIKDKPMYRVRVTGYENSRAARAAIPELERTLGLEGAWISRP